METTTTTPLDNLLAAVAGPATVDATLEVLDRLLRDERLSRLAEEMAGLRKKLEYERRRRFDLRSREREWCDFLWRLLIFYFLALRARGWHFGRAHQAEMTRAAAAIGLPPGEAAGLVRGAAAAAAFLVADGDATAARELLEDAGLDAPHPARWTVDALTPDPQPKPQNKEEVTP